VLGFIDISFDLGFATFYRGTFGVELHEVSFTVNESFIEVISHSLFPAPCYSLQLL